MSLTSLANDMLVQAVMHGNATNAPKFSPLPGTLDDVRQGLLSLFYLLPPSQVMSYSTVDQVPKFVSMAIPYFFLLMASELVVNLLRGAPANYRVNDTIMSINLGAFQQMVNFWYKHYGVLLYCYVWSHYRLMDFGPTSMVQYVALLLAVDCVYYWFHRTAHEFHVIWAAHSVHHSGEDYNVATALRQGAMQGIFSMFLSLPLALVFHPAAYLVHSQLNTLYQFWIHTTAVGHIGWLEYILNTPSHHRMHHRPPGNCNYAGVLIIWDRMFGTFVAEDAQQDYYGLAKQYTNFDAILANLEHPKRMIHNMLHSKASTKPLTLSSYVALLFKRRVRHKRVVKPSALFTNIPPTKQSLWANPPSTPKRTKLEGDAWSCSPVVTMYKLVLFAASMAMFVVLLGFQSAPGISPVHVLFLQVYVCAFTMSLGYLSTSAKLGKRAEWYRVFLSMGIVCINCILDNAEMPLFTKPLFFGISSDVWLWITFGNTTLWTAVYLVTTVKRYREAQSPVTVTKKQL